MKDRFFALPKLGISQMISQELEHFFQAEPSAVSPDLAMLTPEISLENEHGPGNSAAYSQVSRRQAASSAAQPQ